MIQEKKGINNTDLSIVIPAYREEKRISKTLDELSYFLKQNAFIRTKDVEVIVVVAASEDNTGLVAKSKARKFRNFRIYYPGTKEGKGRDVQQGMLNAKGNYIMFMDADLATPLHHVEEFYKDCVAGADIVAGTRNMRKHHPNLARRSISNIGNVLFRILGGVWIEDSQCGFKMFNQRASKMCFSKLTIMGWGFDMEVLAIAKANGLKIKTRRLDDWKNIPGGTFSDSLLKNSVRSLWDLSRIFVNRVTGSYRKV